MSAEDDDFSLCVLNNARKAARAVSRYYDRLARQAGFTAGQFSVLVAIQAEDDQTIADLVERLSMERTTLVRNLALVERKGMVLSNQREGERGKRYRLSSGGEALLEKAVPLWRQAQDDMKRHLGDEDFFKAVNLLQRLSKV
ncbi:MarR family transcriptional regulator [Roseibium denhamense]|uniref:DNA-binding transcriptional regulator, MarR family n=1 Tax=Roseibium denhamense TaxID=76305 RepID=A0ABY1P5I6_9HYPH|nr:MarR family winged helix-turn-helix transcriptional regulator [Roseibium denhamense]MTI07122.1 MarR family transcriptional regulator [Roseibium denhamense]SMP26968.1 DNA-binding transcriptional regulator, MarR family [Roseibium denhamense]